MGNSVTLQICRSASKYTKKRLYFISFKSNKSRKITNIENKTLKSKLLFAVTFWVVVEVQLLYNVVLVSGVQFFKVFWNLFVFGCTRASLLPMGFLQLQQVGTALQLRRYRLLLARASLAAEHKLQGTGASVVHGLVCPLACGILTDQGLNLWPLRWQKDS